METCGIVADVNPATGHATLYLTSQAPHAHRTLFAMFAVLVANGSVTISEFAGIAAALELFGIPRLLGVPVVALALWWIIVAGSSEPVVWDARLFARR